MTALSTADALRAAQAAGFQGDALITAVAVARAESGLRYDAVGDSGRSIGLWQVHLPSHPTYNAGQLYDPLANARAAYEISGGGTNWQPWTVYKTGAYTQHVPAVRAQAETLGLLEGQPFSIPGGHTGETVGWADQLNPWKPKQTEPGLIGEAAASIFDPLVGWLSEQFLVSLLTVVFSAGALGLIALGVMRLTGTKPTAVLGAASKATGAGALASAAI
jgi:hypothetical protein